MSSKDSITLKWGSLKSWNINNNRAAYDALEKWHQLGTCASAALHEDTPEQKELVCLIIDLANCNQIYLSWEGKYVSKEEAKKYVMEYEKDSQLAQHAIESSKK